MPRDTPYTAQYAAQPATMNNGAAGFFSNFNRYRRAEAASMLRALAASPDESDPERRRPGMTPQQISAYNAAADALTNPDNPNYITDEQLAQMEYRSRSTAFTPVDHMHNIVSQLSGNRIPPVTRREPPAGTQPSPELRRQLTERGRSIIFTQISNGDSQGAYTSLMELANAIEGPLGSNAADAYRAAARALVGADNRFLDPAATRALVADEQFRRETYTLQPADYLNNFVARRSLNPNGTPRLALITPRPGTGPSAQMLSESGRLLNSALLNGEGQRAQEILVSLSRTMSDERTANAYLAAANSLTGLTRPQLQALAARPLNNAQEVANVLSYADLMNDFVSRRSNGAIPLASARPAVPAVPPPVATRPVGPAVAQQSFHIIGNITFEHNGRVVTINATPEQPIVFVSGPNGGVTIGAMFAEPPPTGEQLAELRRQTEILRAHINDPTFVTLLNNQAAVSGHVIPSSLDTANRSNPNFRRDWLLSSGTDRLAILRTPAPGPGLAVTPPVPTPPAAIPFANPAALANAAYAAGSMEGEGAGQALLQAIIPGGSTPSADATAAANRITEQLRSGNTQGAITNLNAFLTSTGQGTLNGANAAAVVAAFQLGAGNRDNALVTVNAYLRQAGLPPDQATEAANNFITQLEDNPADMTAAIAQLQQRVASIPTRTVTPPPPAPRADAPALPVAPAGPTPTTILAGAYQLGADGNINGGRNFRTFIAGLRQGPATPESNAAADQIAAQLSNALTNGNAAQIRVALRAAGEFVGGANGAALANANPEAMQTAYYAGSALAVGDRNNAREILTQYFAAQSGGRMNPQQAQAAADRFITMANPQTSDTAPNLAAALALLAQPAQPAAPPPTVTPPAPVATPVPVAPRVTPPAPPVVPSPPGVLATTPPPAPTVTARLPIAGPERDAVAALQRVGQLISAGNRAEATFQMRQFLTNTLNRINPRASASTRSQIPDLADNIIRHMANGNAFGAQNMMDNFLGIQTVGIAPVANITPPGTQLTGGTARATPTGGTGQTPPNPPHVIGPMPTSEAGRAGVAMAGVRRTPAGPAPAPAAIPATTLTAAAESILRHVRENHPDQAAEALRAFTRANVNQNQPAYANNMAAADALARMSPEEARQQFNNGLNATGQAAVNTVTAMVMRRTGTAAGNRTGYTEAAANLGTALQSGNGTQAAQILIDFNRANPNLNPAALRANEAAARAFARNGPEVAQAAAALQRGTNIDQVVGMVGAMEQRGSVAHHGVTTDGRHHPNGMPQGGGTYVAGGPGGGRSGPRRF